jgi:beta-glucosidase
MRFPQIDRRQLLAGGSTAATTLLAGKASAVPKPGFLWGTAGAAYQIEGGNVASDIWALEHMKPTLFAEPSGDADDVYNRIEDDLALAASLGFNAHRLSIEWSRIEPEPGQISLSALAYYRRVLESCRRRGLAPVVTFNHYTVPRWFAASGGFDTADGIAPFVRYCELVTRHMGDQIAVAATFNEPNVNALLSWTPMLQKMAALIGGMRKAVAAATGAPRWSSPLLGDFRVQQPIMIEAHARAYDAINGASGGRFPVGVTLSLNDDKAADGDTRGLEAKRAQVLTPWLAAPGDMIGIQNYTESTVGPTADLPNAPGVEVTQMDYPYAPRALEAVIRLVASRTRKTTSAGSRSSARRCAACRPASPMASTCAATCTGRCSTTGNGPADTGPSSGWLRWIAPPSGARPSPARPISAGSPAPDRSPERGPRQTAAQPGGAQRRDPRAPAGRRHPLSAP